MGIEVFTDGTMSRSIWTRATHVPPHVPRSLGRYYIYWRFFYVLAGFEHTLSLIAFLQSGVTFMAIFNVFSVALFVAAFFLLKAGYYQTAYWSAITELVLHGIAATICIGPQFGFTNYTFLVVVLVFIQPFYSWRVSLVLAVLALASAAMVTAYALDNPPVYTLSEDWARTMIIRQVIAWPISVLIMVLPFIGASARAEKELAAAYAESERLLLNILPSRIAKRLKATSDMIADDRERVAILFADIVGFYIHVRAPAASQGRCFAQQCVQRDRRTRRQIWVGEDQDDWRRLYGRCRAARPGRRSRRTDSKIGARDRQDCSQF